MIQAVIVNILDKFQYTICIQEFFISGWQDGMVVNACLLT